MYSIYVFALFTFIVQARTPHPITSNAHLSFTGKRGEVVITWTDDRLGLLYLNVTCVNSFFQQSFLGKFVNNTQVPEKFRIQNGNYNTVFVVINGLPVGSPCSFSVVDQDEKNTKKEIIHNFICPSSRPPAGRNIFSIALVADMGLYYTAPFTRAALLAEENINALIMPGDLSYADGNSHVWDAFFGKMAPLLSRVPFYTCPGNHEGKVCNNFFYF